MKLLILSVKFSMKRLILISVIPGVQCSPVSPQFPVSLSASFSVCWSVCLSAFHLAYTSDFYEEYNTLELLMLCNSSLLTGSVSLLTSNVLRYFFFKTTDYHHVNVSNK